MSEGPGVRDTLEEGLSAALRGAEEIFSLIESCDLLLALDVAVIREAQGPADSLPTVEATCPIANLDRWDAVIEGVQAKLQESRNSLSRLRAENLRFKEELAWQLP